MNKITLTKQQIELLDTGSKIKTKEGYIWYYIPYYFKSTNEQGVFEEYTFEKLPKGIKKFIKEQNKKNEY